MYFSTLFILMVLILFVFFVKLSQGETELSHYFTVPIMPSTILDTEENHIICLEQGFLSTSESPGRQSF